MNQGIQENSTHVMPSSKRTSVASCLLLLVLVSGCQTPPEEARRGDFRFREVPAEKASYTVVVESLSGIVDIRDYDAMETLVVREFNQAGLPAIRMFESGETTHYLYVFLQRTDDVLQDVQPEAPGTQASELPQRWAASNPRYLRGSGLQTPAALLWQHGQRSHANSQEQSAQLAGKLSVLFAVFEREELDSLIIDNPNPEPQLDGMFLADLQEEFLTSEDLRAIASTTAQRILEAQTDPQAVIAATTEREALEQEKMEHLRPNPFPKMQEPLLSQNEGTVNDHLLP